MSQFWIHYLKALGLIALIMAIYSVSVVPLIEPPEQKPYEIPSTSLMQVGDRWWQGLFSQDQWQTQQPTVHHHKRGVLLAQNWEQIEKKSWKVTPLTIVLTETSSEDLQAEDLAPQNVWVISAQKAIIHLDQPLDISSGKIPSVEKGELEGEILIRQINSSAPEHSLWQLRTQDINIDRRLIWTQQEVQIDFDGSRIRGHDLRINLIHDILSYNSERADQSASKYGPLDSIELMHLTEMNVGLDPGGIWANVDSRMLSVTQPVKNMPARLEATCGGRFSFLFSKESASLTGGVHLKHFLGGFPADEFLCHRLNLRLQSAPLLAGSGQTKVGSSSTGPNTSEAVTGFSVRDLDAYGIDSVDEFVGEKWVEVKSPLIQLAARSKRLHYDVAKQRLEMSGRLNQPAATQSIVELDYQGYQFRAPTIEYQAPPKSADRRAEHGGWLAAQGAGEITTPTNSQYGSTHIRWSESFTWSPSQESGQQQIVLSGHTLIDQKSYGFMMADSLSLWLANATQAPHTSSSTTNISTEGFQPKRLLAQGNATLAAGRAQVHVQALDVAFAYPPNDSPDVLARSAATTRTQGPGSLSTFVGSPLESQSADQSADPALVVTGQSLVATIARANQQSWIDAMSIHGPLDVKATAQDQRPQWTVQGQSLNLATNALGELDVEIEGQPAVVAVADGSIQGSRIGFNQNQNRIWMDRPGEFTLPESLPSVNGQSIKWASPLRCTWQKRMVFDGNLIRFEGDIELLGTLQQADGLWFLKGSCQELNLLMDRPVRLDQFSAQDTSAQLQQVVLRDNVDLLASRKDNAGNRLSCARLSVPTTLTVYVPQEKIVAEGPGRAYSNFVSTREVSDYPSNRSNAPRLDTVSVTFRDAITAFLDRKEVTIDGSVKVLVSPIEHWEAELSPQEIARLKNDQFSCFSDQIKVYDTSDLSSTRSLLAAQGSSIWGPQWELQANGNVRFDGMSTSGQFTGAAHRAAFVQAKDQLYLAGDGRSKAIIKKAVANSTMQVEPSNTVLMLEGVFNVKTFAILSVQGLEYHRESGDVSAYDSNAVNSNSSSTPLRPGVPTQNNQVAPQRSQLNSPADRSINRLLQGYAP